MEGISNKGIVNFINEKNKRWFLKKFVVVFSANFINKCINFHDIVIHSEGKYSFVRYALVELFRSTSNERI